MAKLTHRLISKNVVSNLILLAILVAGTVIGVSAVYFFYEPSYEVCGYIHVAPAVLDTLTGQTDRGDISNYDSFMRTQALAITKNTTVLEKVADEFADRNLAFFNTNPKSLFERLTHGFMKADKPQNPLGVLKKSFRVGVISVSPRRGTEYLEISMKSKFPGESKLIVNSIIRNYVADYAYGETLQSERNLTTLEDRASVLKQKVERGQIEIERLASEFGSRSLDTQHAVMVKDVGELKKQLAQLESQRLNLEIALELAERGVDVNQPQAVDWDPLLQYLNQDEILKGYRERLVDLKIEQAEMADAHDIEKAKVREKVLGNIQVLIDDRKDVLKNELMRFEQERQSRLKKQGIAVLQNELDGVLKKQKRLQAIFQSQNTDTKQLRFANLELKDLELQLAWDREMYEQIRRRINQLQLQRNQIPRMTATGADNHGFNDPRLKYSLIIVLSTMGIVILLSTIRVWLGRKKHRLR